MPVTDPQLLPWLTGPYAALVLALIVIWGLWRLYQQERAERRQNFEKLSELTTAVREMLDAETKRARR